MKKGLVIIAVVAIAAMVFYGIRFAQEPLNSVTAAEVTVLDAADADGYIIREERVYTAPASGTVYSSSTEGSRVANNSLLFTVYSQSISTDTLRELNVINKKIANARQDSARSSLYSSSSSTSVESSVQNKTNDIIEAAAEGDIEQIYQYKSDINNIRAGTYTEENKLEVLQSQKDQIEQQLGDNYSEVYSEAAGVYTTILDGMEEQLTPGGFSQLTPSYLESLEVTQSRTATTTVSAGDRVCKVVNNHLWYAAAVMDTAQAGRCTEGEEYELSFDSIRGGTVEGKVVYKSQDENGRSVVVFESSSYLEGVYSYRQSGMRVIFESYTGFGVPQGAVKTQDGVTGVFAERDNVQNFYPCDVLYTDEGGYSVIRSKEDAQRQLENGDRILTGEQEVQ